MIRDNIINKKGLGRTVHYNPDHALANGLIKYWVLDQISGTSTRDIVGSDSGTLVGFALSGSTSNWIYDKNGVGLHFVGGDRVGAGSSPSVTYTDDLTFCCWYKSDTTDASRRIVTKGGPGAGAWIPMLQSGQVGQSGANVYEEGTTATSVTAGQLYFGVGLFDGVNTEMKHYRDGVLIDTQDYTSTPSSPSTGEWLIGCRRRVSTYEGHFDGTIYEVRIYDRLLSEDEITILYNTPHIDFNRVIRTYGYIGI